MNVRFGSEADMSAIGNLYDMPVYVEESLGENENIAFNAGSHTELIKLPYKDFERLVHHTHPELYFLCTDSYELEQKRMLNYAT